MEIGYQLCQDDYRVYAPHPLVHIVKIYNGGSGVVHFCGDSSIRLYSTVWVDTLDKVTCEKCLKKLRESKEES